MKVRRGVVVAAVAVPLLARAADTSLLDALRKHDVEAVRTLRASGADPNTRDETGASELMYAAVYSSPDEMRLLIGKGADVNSANVSAKTRNGTTGR